MSISRAQYAVGQVVCHQLFGYRGVIFDVDASFGLSDEWYEQMARSRPPKDHPWYHVLVHDAAHMTYVAERNLSPDPSGEPVRHALLDEHFSGFENGGYTPRRAN